MNAKDPYDHKVEYWFFALSLPAWVLFVLQLTLCKASHRKGQDEQQQKTTNEQEQEVDAQDVESTILRLLRLDTWSIGDKLLSFWDKRHLIKPKLMPSPKYGVQLINVIEIICMIQQHWYERPLPNGLDTWYAIYFILLWQAQLLNHSMRLRCDAQNLVFLAIPAYSALIGLMHTIKLAIVPPFEMHTMGAFEWGLVILQCLRLGAIIPAIAEFSSGYPEKVFKKLMLSKSLAEAKETLKMTARKIGNPGGAEDEKRDHANKEGNKADEVSILSLESLKTLFNLACPGENRWLQCLLPLQYFLPVASRWLMLKQSLHLTANLERILSEYPDKYTVGKTVVIFALKNFSDCVEEDVSKGTQHFGMKKLNAVYHGRAMELSPDAVYDCMSSPNVLPIQANTTWRAIEGMFCMVIALFGNIWISVQASRLISNDYVVLLLLAEAMHYLWLTLEPDTEQERLGSQISKDFSRYHKAYDASTNNWEVVVANNKSKFEQDKVQEEFLKMNLSMDRFVHRMNTQTRTEKALLSATHACAAVLTLYGVWSGQYNKDYFFLVLANWSHLGAPYQALNSIIRTWTNEKTKIEDFLRICRAKPTVYDSPGAKELVLEDPPAIEFTGVSHGRLEDISFAVGPGQVVALVGYSGCGKSTLARLLLRLSDPESGSIKINDQPLNLITLESLRKHVSFIFQGPKVWTNESFSYNARYANTQASDEEIREAYKAVGLHDFIVGLPDGYETLLSAAKLSPGQLQRLPIVCQLLKKSSGILVLDEATSSVDVKTEFQIQEAIKLFAKNRTVVVIAHHLATIKHADLILVMHEGRIVELGKHSELLMKNGSYKELWDINSRNETGGSSPAGKSDEPTADEAAR